MKSVLTPRQITDFNFNRKYSIFNVIFYWIKYQNCIESVLWKGTLLKDIAAINFEDNNNKNGCEMFHRVRDVIKFY